VSDLPLGWTNITLADAGPLVGGKTPSKSSSAYWDRGTVPWTSPKDMKSFVLVKSEDMITPHAVNDAGMEVLPVDSVLMVTRSGILEHTFPVAITAMETSINQDIKALRPSQQLLPRYAAYALRSFGQEILTQCSKEGTTVASVNTEALEKFPLPLAPRDEQKRIASKLDAVLAKVDMCRARLDRMPQILKKFREAVLEAAVSGRLTEEWRAERQLAETTQTIHLGDENIKVPGVWGARGLGDAIDSDRPLCYGVVQPGESVAKGVKLIRIQDMDVGRIAISELRTISAKIDEEYRRSRVNAGDLLVSVVGTIGRTAIVPEGLVSNIARAIARISPAAEIDGRWLRIWLESAKLQWWMLKSSKEVARKTLNLGDLAKAPLAVPGPAEQTEIIRRVEQLLGLADSFQLLYESAQTQLEALVPSVLAKAFRGELVPQDPNDEPAGQMLERIKAERTNTAESGRAHGKPASRTTGRRGKSENTSRSSA
jgi:type I restriction enzyme, S subunit